MAPVHSVNSYSFSASSAKVSSNSHCSKGLTDNCERNLPIFSRGRFFEDSFFENAWSRYEGKIKRILDEWEETNTLFEDWDDTPTRLSHKHLFRNIPERNQHKQVISATSENGDLKILLDVREFTAEDLKVRVIGEREIEVEGYRKQKENETTNYHKRRNNFHYLISLPEEADMDTITSAMSADGILSICVPIKKFFSQTVHQVPVAVSEDKNTRLSSGSASSGSFSEKFSDVFSQSSSKSSSTTVCGNLLNKQKEASEKFGERTDVKMHGHQSSCHLGEMQSALESDSYVEELLNKDNHDISEGSCEFQNTSNVCKETGKQAVLDMMNSKETKADTSVSEEKELGQKLIRESFCSSSSFKNIAVTEREPVSNNPFFENVKMTCNISGDQNLVNSDAISCKDSASMICHGHATSVTKNGNKSLGSCEDLLKFVDQQKQPNEFIVPIRLDDMQPTVNDALRKEDRGLQNEQSLIHGTNVSSAENHRSLESFALDDTVSSTENSESVSHQCVSSDQRLEEHVIQEETEILRNSLDSNGVQQNMDVSQSEGHFSKGFATMNKTTCVNEQEETTEKEMIMHSHDELQASLNPNSEIVDKYVDQEHITKGDSSEMTLIESEHSLGEFQAVKTDSSSACNSVVCNASTPKVTRSLSITKMGSFFTDSYFEGMQNYYLAAAREVLAKYGNFSPNCDEVTCYRNLRMQNQEEPMTAITFEKENKLHFILDVYDIMKKGEIIVNFVNEKKIVVKEKINGMHRDAEFANFFSKVLHINEEVDTSSAEAALSSEGILVISIPKTIFPQHTSTTSEANEGNPNCSSLCSDVTLKEMTAQDKAESSQTTENQNLNEVNCLTGETRFPSCYSKVQDSGLLYNVQSGERCTNIQKHSADESCSTERSDYMVHQEGVDSHSIHNSLDTEDSTDRRCFVYEAQPVVELISNNKNEQQVQVTSHHETDIFAPDEDNKEATVNRLAEQVSLLQDKVLLDDSQKSQKALVTGSGDHLPAEVMETPSSLRRSNSVCVAVEKRALFHEDTFFDGFQKYLLASVREILSDYYDVSASEEEEMTLYRKLISSQGLKEEHQTASASFEDECSYKVVIDAHKFMKISEVTLSIQNTIMKISIEETDDDGLRKCFSKSFAVPDDLDIENVVAGISSDGILAITLHKKEISSGAHNAASHGSNVSMFSSSSATDSHISSTPELNEEAKVSDNTETTNEVRQGEIQVGNGKQSRTDGYQENRSELLNIVQTSTISEEMMKNNNDNTSDEDDDSDASTVVAVPCSLEISSITDDESLTFSPTISHGVTLVESPQVEPNSLLPREITGVNEARSEHQKSSQLMHTGRQLLQQSSNLSIHTVDESESDCNDFWCSATEGISRNSSCENYSLCNNGSLSPLGLSGTQENCCLNASMNQAYSSQTGSTISTQSKSMNNYLGRDQEEVKENSRYFSSLQPTENELSNENSGEIMHYTMLNTQMTNKQMTGETFGFSKNAVEATVSCTTDSMRNQQCTKSRRFLTLTKRGMFFEDPFFGDIHENFHTAMKEVLRKSNDEEKCKHSSDIASYKCWRKQNTKIENQAVYIYSDQNIHKVILDVEGLLDDSITISVVDGKELVIDGQTEMLENSSKRLHIHTRYFTLPDQVDLDAITATLSSDGILLISSPKISF